MSKGIDRQVMAPHSELENMLYSPRYYRVLRTKSLALFLGIDLLLQSSKTLHFHLEPYPYT